MAGSLNNRVITSAILGVCSWLILVTPAYAAMCNTGPMELPERPRASDYSDQKAFMADVLAWKEKEEQFTAHKETCPHLYRLPVTRGPAQDALPRVTDTDPFSQDATARALAALVDQHGSGLSALSADSLANSMLVAGGLINLLDIDLAALEEALKGESIDQARLAQLLLANAKEDLRIDLTEEMLEVLLEGITGDTFEDFFVRLSGQFIIKDIKTEDGLRVVISTENDQIITGQILGQSCLSSC